MGVTAGIIVGGVLTAGATTASIVNSNKQAGDAKIMAQQQEDNQTKLYNEQKQDAKQQEQDQQGAGAAVNTRTQASEFEANNIKQASGAQSTILTSPLGIPDSENSSLQKKTLLGV